MVTNREVFDQIAPRWYQVRHWSRFRGDLTEVATRWGEGRLLNIGSAHGPDFLPFKDNFELWGADFSGEMIKHAQQYAVKFDLRVNLVVADAVTLPFGDNSFDYAIGVAVYHHIKGREQRLEAFSELRRVLKPQGEAFVTVWNRWQPRFLLKGKEVNIAWKASEGTVYRYHYLYDYRDLRNMLTQAGFEIVRMAPEESHHLPVKYFSRNICALVRAP